MKKEQQLDKKEIRSKQKQDPKFKEPEMKAQKVKKEDPSSFMAYRCTWSSLINLFEELQKKNLLKAVHIEAIKKTSFASFFDLLINKKIKENVRRKQYQTLDKIIMSYIPEEYAFLMGESTKKISFSPEFISVLFGLPMTGRLIDISGKYSKSTEFEEKFFADRKRSITKKVVENLIVEQVTKEEEIEAEDFVKLLLIYAWATFFNAQAGGSVPRTFVSEISTIESINSISWPTLIHSLLSKSIAKHHFHPRSVSGCVYILLYMISEYTTLGKKFDEINEELPRVSRWNIDVFFDKDYNGKFQNITDEHVKTELENLSNKEKMLMTTDVEEMQEELKEDSKEKLSLVSLEEKMQDMENDTLIAIKKSFEEENMKLKEDIKKVLEEKTLTIKEREQNQVLLETMEIERQKLTNLMDKITKQKEELQKQLEDAQKLLQQKNKDDVVNSMKEENDKLKIEIENLKKKLVENKDEMVKLMKEKEAKNLLQLQKKDDVMKSLKEKNSKLQAENESLQNRLEQNKSEMEKLVEEKDKAVQELTSREADYGVSYIESQQSTQSKIDELKATLHDLEEENKQLKRNLGLDRLDEEMAEKEGNSEEVVQKMEEEATTTKEDKENDQKEEATTTKEDKAKDNKGKEIICADPEILENPVPIQEIGKLWNPSTSVYWKTYTQEEKNLILNFYGSASKSKLAWKYHDDILMLQIQGQLLDDLLHGMWVDYQIIDWYLMFDIKKKLALLPKTDSQPINYVCFPASTWDLIGYGAPQKDEAFKIVDAMLEKEFNCYTNYIFIPMRSTQVHWTLLMLHLQNMQWHHYNPLQRNFTKSAKSNPHLAAALEMRSFAEEVLESKFLEFMTKKEMKYKKQIVIDDAQLQKNNDDCGLYICKFVEDFILGYTSYWGEDAVKKLRGEMVVSILSDPKNSWNINEDPDALQAIIGD